MRRRGFTLIELLVVIAIIALLISILLPALGRARKAGYLAVSMSNLRQVNVGGATYRDSNKNRLPLFCTKRRGFTVYDTPPPTEPGSGGVEGWCTWAYGGKNNESYWSGKVFDVEAADRPMNSYVYEGLDWEAPAPPAVLPKDSSARKQEAKVFKDPSDKVTHQRAWPLPTPGFTAYDDVGTSYQFNAKWFEQLPTSIPFVARFEFGIKRMTLAEAFNPSKFAWMNDEYADIIVNSPNKKFQLKNGYDDVNKSLLGFLDGHAAYLTVFPGKERQSYINDKYTFVFEDLRVPGT